MIDASISDPYILYGVLKVGLIFSKIHGLRPVAFPYPSTRAADLSMVESMCAQSIPVTRALLKQLLLRLPSILRIALSARTKADILKIRINGIPVGPYIYDQCYVPRVDRISLRMRARIIYSALCFYVDESAIKERDVKLVVIGDPIYRGFLFELCKAYNIKCINAINVGAFQMHKYYELAEFDNSCRFVSPGMLDLLPDSPEISERIDRYFDERFSGSIHTHDVLRAYSTDKRILSKDQLYQEHSLQPGKPLAVVMAHCFKDTPHAVPSLIFRDYEDWIIRTIKALKTNTSINVLVKEHPAHDLYGEQGLLKSILESLGMEHALLRDDINTRTIIDAADYIITCGGTIGAEAAAFGKQVLVAAHPPYARKGFTIEPKTATEYESILRERIHTLPVLSKAQIWAARKTAYILLALYDNSKIGMELGGIRYVLGEEYDIKEVYKNVIEENCRPLEEQKIYARLLEFHRSDDVSIINYDKLRSVGAPAIPDLAGNDE